MKKLALKLFMFLSPIWVRFFKYIAISGHGTDICLHNGFLPMPVHFYSPVPDLVDLEQRKIYDKKSELVGINFKPEQQLKLLLELGKNYGLECDWPRYSTDSPLDFSTENSSFSFGCAAALHTIIRQFKPRQIIEIGSGHSSKIILKAIEMNRRNKPSQRTEYVIIDPYPGEIVAKQLSSVSRLIKEKVECVDTKLFDVLKKNDILFIDSGHTVRTGSDVNFIILDILPKLRPGVIAHFHDINLPYEYPKVYFTNPKFRVFWTEAYLLQAFLACNRDFEILLAMNYIQTDHMNVFCKAFPKFVPVNNLATSGSFWIRRL